MKFEYENGIETVAIFEVDPIIKIHEQHVAANALGYLTLVRRKDSIRRAESAMLGAKIMVLDNTETNKDEKTQKEDTIPVNSSMELPEDEAKLLALALHEFSEDTPQAILSNPSSPHSCNVRAIEGDLADTMLRQINDQYGFERLETVKTKVGF